MNKYYSIYSLSPAPWGDDYRLVEIFDNRADAELVLKALESVNAIFNCYEIVEWEK
jgi:hypothetical protein